MIRTDLVWANTGGIEVGIASSRVNGVLFKVLTDVFWGGLRQQSINTLPEEQKGGNKNLKTFSLLEEALRSSDSFSGQAKQM